MIGKSGMAMISIAALGIGGAALAQQTAPAPQGQPPTGQQQAGVSPEQAAQIARNNGMTHIAEIDRDNDHWEVEGSDGQGREIEVKINIVTGEVLDIERD